MRMIDPKNPANRLYVSDFVIEQMQKIPTIEAEPVKHGRWGEYEVHPLAPSLNGYPCMVCGQHEQRTTNYCPNCGAKMRGGAENGT